MQTRLCTAVTATDRDIVVGRRIIDDQPRVGTNVQVAVARVNPEVIGASATDEVRHQRILKDVAVGRVDS